MDAPLSIPDHPLHSHSPLHGNFPTLPLQTLRGGAQLLLQRGPGCGALRSGGPLRPLRPCASGGTSCSCSRAWLLRVRGVVSAQLPWVRVRVWVWVSVPRSLCWISLPEEVRLRVCWNGWPVVSLARAGIDVYFFIDLNVLCVVSSI